MAQAYRYPTRFSTNLAKGDCALELAKIKIHAGELMRYLSRRLRGLLDLLDTFVPGINGFHPSYRQRPSETTASNYIEALEGARVEEGEWREVLRDEYARLDNLELKGRTVLAPISLAVPLVAYVATQLNTMKPWAHTGSVVLCIATLAFLVLAALHAVNANQIGRREYLDPDDYRKAIAAHPSTDPKVTKAAVCLRLRDRMGANSVQKSNSVDASIRSLRNALVALLLCVALVLLSTNC